MTVAADKPIGLIGLGLMGTAIADRLLEHGYRVHVWNRTRDKASRFLDRGASWSDNPIADCDRVIISLYSSDVVAQVLEQMQPGFRPGQLLIDTTTGDPEACLALGEKLDAMGVRYLDAPISGSSEQTRRGEATVLVGGDAGDFAEGLDLWKVLGKRVFHVGGRASAAKMKLVSNLVLGLNRAALAEGLAFAAAIGVSPASALEVLEHSAAYSKVMEVKGQKMLTEDFQTQAKLSQHLKDVRLIVDSAAANGLTLPLSQTHQKLLEQAEAYGYGELDNCSIIKVYSRRSDEQ
jgi:3-hydroxyisobutyrate dehydrogenase-like beta-hydroxyacid dehydrogenase